MIDNTTAVEIINTMSTCHCDPCNSVACEIWKFCKRNGIWLTAAYIPGKQNITADMESRIDTEWMLNPQCLAQALCSIPFSPLIDLFASPINKQFEAHVSYHPDPYAKHTMHLPSHGQINKFIVIHNSAASSKQYEK